MSDIFRHPTPQAAASAAATRIAKIIHQTCSQFGKVTIAVSGGSTPKLLFQELLTRDVAWAGVHVFWVDERAVPPDDEQSNFRLTKEYLLDSLKDAGPTVHRIQAELKPAEAARLYTDDIVNFFRLSAGEIPVFDIVQLGMGDDAHTASLFPGEPQIQNHSGIAAALYVEKKTQWRITLLPGPIQHARYRICLIAGSDKAQPLKAVLETPADTMRFPAQLANTMRGPTEWYVDEAAASLLS